MRDQANAEEARLNQLQLNARNTHLGLHQEIRELTAELHELYEREARLLNLLDKRDKQLDSIDGGRAIAVPPTQPYSDRVLDKNSLELDLLKKRYAALSGSKLGRLQLWYWRFRVGR